MSLGCSPSDFGDLDGFGLTVGLIIAFGSIIICILHAFGIYF